MAAKKEADKKSFVASVWGKTRQNAIDKIAAALVGIAATVAITAAGWLKPLMVRFEPVGGRLAYKGPMEVAIGDPIPLNALVIPQGRLDDAEVKLRIDDFFYLSPNAISFPLGSLAKQGELPSLYTRLPTLTAVKPGIGKISFQLFNAGKSITETTSWPIVIREQWLGTWDIKIDGVAGKMHLSETAEHRIFGAYRLDDGQTFGGVLGSVDGSQRRFNVTMTKGESTVRWVIDAPLSTDGNRLFVDGTLDEQQAGTHGWTTGKSHPTFHAERILTSAAAI